ncbi:TonB-dependent receptor [Ideonella sp. DXS22W]|uniref:TonB-dependent receptor n=1 Tax=Pseudaquabacterium inlustre TaxID=2984192 RepID=A0ABU9CLT1_9BURK
MIKTFALRPLSGLMAAAGLITAAVPVIAQTTAPAATAESAKDVQEVVVTANKRSTLASKTPLALTVVDGDQLKAAGVVDARTIQDISPGVQISQDSGRLQINIRGVMSINTTERGDPSNAFNIDGMYVGRPEAQFASFLDVQRVEVLRGPQGTLYGRNATGGAVNVISNKPGNKLGGKVSLELGNYNARRAEVAVDVPVNDLLKLRAAVNANKRDSFFSNPSGIGLEDQDDLAARVHGLLTFSKDTSLLLTAEHSKINSNGFTPVPLTNFFSGTAKGGNATWPNDLLNPVWIGDSVSNEVKLTVPDFYAKPTTRYFENNGLRAELRHNTRLGEVVYQLGWLQANGHFDNISAFNGNPFRGNVNASNNKQISHELRLQSPDNQPFTWVVGAYYFDENLGRDIVYNTFVNSNFTFRMKFLSQVENTAKALFGQSSYALSPTLRLVTGARYSQDTKFATDPCNGGCLTIPAAPFSRQVDSAKATWKLGLDWDLSKETFVYGALSTGYKAGGFNTSSDTMTYRPEELAAAEVGVKTRLLNNRLQLSASAFAYDYKDLQLSSTVCVTNAQNVSTCGTRTVNAEKATMKGFELEGRFRPFSQGVFDMAVALNKTAFGTYMPVNKPVQAPTVVVDWTGQALDRAPKTTVRLGYTHTFELANGSAIEAGVAARHNSGYLMSSYGDDYATRYRQPAFTKYDAQVSWRSADDKYSVQLFGKNLSDEITVENRLPSSVNVAEPRTYGVRVNAKF